MISRYEFYAVVIVAWVTSFQFGKQIDRIHDELKALREKLDKR